MDDRTIGESVVVPDAEVTFTEQFVFDTEQLRTFDHEVTTPSQAHGLTTGGSVERLGHRGAPVHHDRVAILVGHGQAADVEALGTRHVVAHSIDAAEHQGSVSEFEFGEAAHQLLVDRVALEAVLERAPGSGFGETPDLPGVLTTPLEAVVGPVDVRLFEVEIGVLSGHTGSLGG